MFMNITWYCSSSLPRKPLEDGCGCWLGIRLRRRRRFRFGWRKLVGAGFGPVAECRPGLGRRYADLMACCSWCCWHHTYQLVLGQQSCKAGCASFQTRAAVLGNSLSLCVFARPPFCIAITPHGDVAIFLSSSSLHSSGTFFEPLLRTLSSFATSIRSTAVSSFSHLLLFAWTIHLFASFHSQGASFLQSSSSRATCTPLLFFFFPSTLLQVCVLLPSLSLISSVASAGLAPSFAFPFTVTGLSSSRSPYWQEQVASVSRSQSLFFLRAPCWVFPSLPLLSFATRSALLISFFIIPAQLWLFAFPVPSALARVSIPTLLGISVLRFLLAEPIVTFTFAPFGSSIVLQQSSSFLLFVFLLPIFAFRLTSPFIRSPFYAFLRSPWTIFPWLLAQATSVVVPLGSFWTIPAPFSDVRGPIVQPLPQLLFAIVVSLQFLLLWPSVLQLLSAFDAIALPDVALAGWTGCSFRTDR